jgi:4-hydroxy-tetrahydrodipicolinate synthase
LAIFSGNDSQVLPILSLGGVGVISVAANVAPHGFAEMCAHYREGRVAEATKLQIKYAGLIESLFIEVNPIPVKEAMNELGWEVGGFRPPLYAMSENAKTLLVTELRNSGLKK